MIDIFRVVKLHNYISVYHRSQSVPVHDYYYDDKEKLEKEFQELLTYFKQLKLNVEMILDGNGFEIEQEKETVDIGENFIGEFWYKGSVNGLNLVSDSIPVKDIVKITKHSPYILYVNLVNDKSAYWVYSNSHSADKKFKELLERVDK
jgi:hypothetical protein